jgi:ACR3 family arsenite efflux pump ArsB
MIGHNIITNVGAVFRVSVPMVIYFALMFTTSLMICRDLNFGYEKSVTQAFTGNAYFYLFQDMMQPMMLSAIR